MRYQTAPRPAARRSLGQLPSEGDANICSLMTPVGDRKSCYRCGELKPVDEFAWRRRARDQRDSFCRPCHSAYGREHYEANRERYIDQAAESKRRLRLKRTSI